jgi:hypothetical protein
MGKLLLTILRAQWDRVAAIVALLLGAIAMLNGWIGVSGTAYAAEQIPFIVSGALVGIFLLGLAAVLWLSADLRDEWRKLADLEDRLAGIEARRGTPAPPETADETGVAPTHGDAQPVTTDLPNGRLPQPIEAGHDPRGQR